MSGNNLPPDDQPSGEVFDFSTGLYGEQDRNEIEDKMINTAMVAYRTRQMKEPLRILNAMRSAFSESADMASSYAKAESEILRDRAPAKRITANLYLTAIPIWAQQITIAMNKTLEALAHKAETEQPEHSQEFCKWLRNQIE